MAKIVAKLNLNKTPQNVENNSLVFAKNIRLLKDSSIAPDTSLEEIDGSHDVTNEGVVTVVDVPAERTYTPAYYLSIYNYTNYDNTNPTKSFLQLDGTTYDNINVDIDEFELNLDGTVYDGDHRDIIIDRTFTFEVTNNQLVCPDAKGSLFVYFIHIEAYRGNISFNQLISDSIVPYYIGFIKNNRLGGTVLIDDEEYVVINPVVVTDEIVGTIVPAQTHEIVQVFSTPTKYIGEIVGLDNKIYIFKEATYQEFIDNGLQYPVEFNDKVKIFEYDEIDKTFKLVKCGWRYSGGEIDGQVTMNNTNEKILTVCEYFSGNGNEADVQIKHINLSNCTITDDETIYTQAPNIPFTNLKFDTYYKHTIPNGVYQFFVRYKIRDDFYTDWFPCSYELYAGVPTIANTIQGTLRYVNTHIDCSKSFVFIVEHLFAQYITNFTEYQIGFIISHEDSVVARSWKSFNFNVNKIYFDYDKNAIEEVDIDEMLKTTYEIFNFNPELQDNASKVNVTLQHKVIEFNQDIPTIDGKELSKSNDSLTYYDIWDGGDIKQLLLDNNDVVKKSILNDSETERNYYKGNNYAMQIKAYWKDAGEIEGQNATTERHRKRDVFWLRELNLNLIHHNTDNNEDIKFETYNYSDKDNVVQANLVRAEHVTDGVPSSRYYDNNNHKCLDVEALTNKWYFRGGYNVEAGPNVIESFHDPGNGWSKFMVYRRGIGWLDRATKDWKNIYINEIKNRYPSVVISKLIINFDGGGTRQIIGDNDIFSGDNNSIIHGVGISNETLSDDVIKNKLFEILKDKILGIKIINDEYKFVCLDSNDTVQEISGISANIIKLNYTADYSQDTGNTSTEKTYTIKVEAECKQQDIQFSIGINKSKTNIDFIEVDERTLMPFTKYQFYIHYLKQNGIPTNGYYICTKEYANYTNVENTVEVIYPIFSNVVIPTGYVGYFISINKVENDVARLFNVRHASDDKEPGYLYADCLEADTMVYPMAKNINIYKNSGTDLVLVSGNGEYFSSGNNNPISEFGNCGEVRWPISDEEDNESINVYSPISKTILVNKNATTKGILIRAGFDDENKTFINKLIDLSTCVDDGIVDKTLLTTALNSAISDASCLEIEVKNQYNSAWEEYEEEHSDDRSESIPVSELIGYNVTISSKIIQSNDYDYNDVQFLGIAVIENDYISTIAEAIDYLDDVDDLTSQRINKLLKEIETYQTQTIHIYAGTAHMLLSCIIYSNLYQNNYWIIIQNDSTNNINKRLTRITPYIRVSSFYNYKQNLPAFIVTVSKLNHEQDSMYISGTDVYEKSLNNDSINLKIIESYIANNSTNVSYIPSNFNFNCVALNEDITQNIRSWLTDPDSPDSDIAGRQFMKSVNSLTCSSILTLPTMYYDFIRKTYSVYNDKQQYIFDNTIRSSDANVDEVYKNIYKFKAEDYYNVPANRGIITKIFNLVNYIYVHTQHSLFKFSGSNNISSTEGEVALKEGDIFETGIQELFDSQNGYAGLQHKKQCVVMFDSYVFWDNYVQQIYAFGGEGKLAVISDSISKIIKQFKPDNIKFVSDEINDRFFINFSNDSGNICLSYNFRLNSFISIHDMDFDHGFNSRLHTYLLNNNERVVTVDGEQTTEYIGWTLYHLVDKITFSNVDYFAAYQNCWKKSIIAINDMRSAKYSYGASESCVDIIFNNNYELIKDVEYINWICSEIQQYGFNNTFVGEESLNRKYGGDKLRIYTDSCATKLIALTTNQGTALVSNDINNLSNPNAWQYPRFNCGIWSFNYFRDVLNITDIFDYDDSLTDTDLTPYTQRQDLTQDNSLVQGKYIVCRFIFNNRNFKFENVEVKVNNYGKVK